MNKSICKRKGIQKAAILLAMAVGAKASSLGYADGYNVFVFTTLQDSSDIGGRAAAGTYFSGTFAVGTGLISSAPNVDVVAGQGIKSGQIQVNSGGNAYVPGATVGGNLLMNGGGKLVSTDPINFSAAQSYYDSLSTQLSGLTATGTISNTGQINASSNGVNVFNLTAAQFDLVTSITTDSGTVIINVAGTPGENGNNMTVDGSQVSTGTNDSKVLFNFYQDKSTLTLGNSFGGSVLAPYATVAGASQYNGTIIANALNFTGEIHGNGEFCGTIPTAAPEPGSVGLLGIGLVAAALGIRRWRKPAQKTAAK